MRRQATRVRVCIYQDVYINMLPNNSTMYRVDISLDPSSVGSRYRLETFTIAYNYIISPRIARMIIKVKTKGTPLWGTHRLRMLKRYIIIGSAVN